MIVSCPLTINTHFRHNYKCANFPHTDQQSPAGPSRPVIKVDAEVPSGAGLGIHIRREIHLSDASASEMAITTKDCGILISRKTGLRSLVRVGAFSWGAVI